MHRVHQREFAGNIGVQLRRRVAARMAQAVAGEMPRRGLPQAEQVVLARRQIEGVEGRDVLLPGAGMGKEFRPAEPRLAIFPADDGVRGHIGGAVGIG